MDFEKARLELESKGSVVVKDKDVGLDVAGLASGLASFILHCDFDDFPAPPPDLDANPHGIRLAELLDFLSREEENNTFTSALYELLPSVPDLSRFASSERLIALVEALGVHSPTLGTSPLVRIDRPGEDFRATPWHQDHWFSFSSLDSVVVWIPMREITKEMGWLAVLPESHKDGLRPFKSSGKSSEPFEPKEEVSEDEAVEVEVPFGSLLIFRQTLLHRSGKNKSAYPRLSLQLRYNSMKGQPRPFSTFTAKHSNHVIQAQKHHAS